MGESAYGYLDLADHPQLIELQRQLKALLRNDDIRWQLPKTFHVTLVYCSDVSDEVLRRSVVNIGGKPVSLIGGGLGVFENDDERALYLKIADNEELGALQRAVYQALANESLDMSPYSSPENDKPHITLAYLPPEIDVAEVDSAFSAVADKVVFARDEYKPYLTLTLSSQTDIKATTMPQSNVEYSSDELALKALHFGSEVKMNADGRTVEGYLVQF